MTASLFGRQRHNQPWNLRLINCALCVKQAAEQGRIQTLSGIGIKTEATILREIEPRL